MLLFQLGLLLLLLPVCVFAPGFCIVRRLPWNPLEKLCGSVGLSLVLLYLVSWAIYCLGDRGDNMPVHPAPFAMVSLVCAGLAAACWRDILRLLRVPSVRRALAGYGFLLLWTGLLLAMIRNYSGAGWFGDWLEHFQRSLFFLRHFPAATTIFPGYPLPARPPMMNVLAAFFLAQTADRFELFQVVFSCLNLLLFLPCYLIIPALGKKAQRRTWLLVLLFATSPLVMENTTYTWTKATAAFYVVLAIWFYLAGWRKQDPVRTTAAFLALAAGLLVHYSAGPYVLILTVHYLVRVFPSRQNKWRELAGIAGSCGLLLGAWLLWALAVYGVQITVASNSSVSYSKAYAGSTTQKIVSNLVDSLVPAVVRDPNLLSRFDQPNKAGVLRDRTFIFYQVNAIFGMGLVGGPLVLWLLNRHLRWKPLPPRAAKGKRPRRKDAGKPAAIPREQRFWLALLGAGVVLGIAVVGERDLFGVAHLTMLALQVIGLSMLAALIPWRRRSVVVLLLSGCAVDFSLGVLLQARVENLDNSAQAIVFPSLEFTGATIQTASPGPSALSQSAWNNWYYKHQLALLQVSRREFASRYGNDPAFQSLLPQLDAQVEQVRADDAAMWQGWFARHGGELQFVGDHTAGRFGWVTTAATVLLAALFLGLAGAVFRWVE